MANDNIQAALFKNDRKERDNQPDFTGPGTVTPEALQAMYNAAVSDGAVFDKDGRIKVRVAGWKKTSGNGKAYISLSIQLEEPRDIPASAPVKKAPAPAEEELF